MKHACDKKYYMHIRYCQDDKKMQGLTWRLPQENPWASGRTTFTTSVFR
jgi:hypothetical protein